MLSFRSITSKISINNWRFLENIKFHEISQIFRNVGHALKLNAHTHSSMHCFNCYCLVVPMAGLAFFLPFNGIHAILRKEKCWTKIQFHEKFMFDAHFRYIMNNLFTEL